MGESLGQWKARPNSSNWDTLPSTLGGGETHKCGSQHPPPHCPFPPAPAPIPDTGSGVAQAAPVGRTCSAQGRACQSAPAGRWTATAV